MSAPDTLETLLNLVTDTIGMDDLCIGMSGPSDVIVPPWYIFAYWRDAPVDEWEIEATGAMLREVLCAVIVSPRFGQ